MGIPQKLLTDPILNNECTDPEVIRLMERLGVPIGRVKFTKEYNARQHGGSPYSKGYEFTEGIINKTQKILVSSGLPMCDANSYALEPGWDLVDGIFRPKHNLFDAGVIDGQVTIEVLNDQPTGVKAGHRLTYTPQLWVGKTEYKPKSVTPQLITDPCAPILGSTTLMWDYEVCKRYVRAIQGRLLSWWEFTEDPKAIIRTKYNQSGDFFLKLGRFKTSYDEELVTPEQFEMLVKDNGWPVKIHDSTTFYPDAHEETSSFDGFVYRHNAGGTTFTDIRDNAGTHSSDDDTAVTCCALKSETDTTWESSTRGEFLFDISAIGAGGTVSAATESFYASAAADQDFGTADINIYSCNPSSNTGANNADYNLVNWGSTAYCATAITAAGFSTIAYNDFIYNATGIAAAQAAREGVLKTGTRLVTTDVGDSEPNAAAGNQWQRFRIYYADNGSNKPKFVATYSSSSAVAQSSSAAKLLSAGAL